MHTILWEDILKVDLPALAKKELPEGRFQVVANLPYYITTPILMELLRFSDLFAGITLMVQKEVAERICAAPGTPAYGAITPAVLYYAEPTIALEVPASAFFPRPQVDSAVLHLTMREKPPVEADPGPLFAVIRAAFMQRRKTLCNALAHGAAAEGYPVSREKVAQSLEKMGLPTDIRGEKLSLSEFAVLSQLCYDL